nr:hypothetical protein [uncultured Draconibacterium sp.]
MKKFVIKTVLSILFFVIIFGILNQIGKIYIPKEDRFLWKYNELFNPNVNADLVIFGTSKSARAINPAILETDSLSAYNLAFDSSTPEFYYYFYNNLFKHYYPKPNLILMDVTWISFMCFDSEQLRAQRNLQRQIEHDARYFPVKDYWDLFFYTNKKHLAVYNRYPLFNRTVGSEGEMNITYNGFTPVAIIKNRGVTKSIRSYIANINPQRQIHYLKLLLNDFKRDSVNVQLIMMPEALDEDLENSPLIQGSIHLLKDVAKNAGFNVIDYRHYLKSNSLFYDWSHANIYGAPIISKKIRQDLEINTSLYDNFNE